MLSIRNISKTYANGVHALRDVTLDVQPGTNVVQPNRRDSTTVWLDLGEKDPQRRYKFFSYDFAGGLSVSKGDASGSIGAYEVLEEWDEQTSWTKQPKTAEQPRKPARAENAPAAERSPVVEDMEGEWNGPLPSFLSVSAV